MVGWIAIHRGLSKHWVFDNPEHLKAWIVILMEVNHNPKKTVIKGVMLNCGRGESLKSLDTWGHLFGQWNKSKVRRFFKLLEKDGMIILKNEKITSRLSVCNYEQYQTERNTDETQTKRKRNANDTKQECKERKNDKKKVYGEYKNVLLTKKEFEKLTKKFNSSTSEIINNLSEAIETYGYKYKSHYLVILKWNKNNKPKPKSDFI